MRFNKNIWVCLSGLMLLAQHFCWGQVKIGNNLQNIDGASLLELESIDKALVLTRVSQDQMEAMNPLQGALVYNLDAACAFIYNGTIWRSLCQSGINVFTSSSTPTVAALGDIWINAQTNAISIYDGSQFVTMNNASMNATNGLTIGPSNAIIMGGDLTQPTTIMTDTVNTLSLGGLKSVDNPNSSVVTLDPLTQELQTTTISNLINREEMIIIASHGQNQFNTPKTILDVNKIDVYRNGVKINFSASGANMITLQPDIICYQNDEIRIVQFF